MAGKGHPRREGMASLIRAVVIRNAKPELEDRRYVVKRAVREKVVEADIFVDGHEAPRWCVKSA
jgi:hypothetical protein